MTFLKFDSVLRGLIKTRACDGFRRTQVVELINFLIKYRHIGKRENSRDEVEPDAFAAVKFKNMAGTEEAGVDDLCCFERQKRGKTSLSEGKKKRNILSIM